MIQRSVMVVFAPPSGTSSPFASSEGARRDADAAQPALIYYFRKSSRRAQTFGSLCSVSQELLNARVAGGTQGRSEQSPALGELVTVRFWHLADDPVCAKKAELAADLGRKTAFVRLCGRRWMKQAA
jgi:hypothetical protein